MKHFKLTFTILFSLAGLVACQGQNVFKHETDPLHNYQDLRNNSVDRTNRGPITNPAAPNNDQATCTTGFIVDLEKDEGAGLAYFTEDMSKSILLKVRSLRDNGQAWNVVPVDMPAGGEFKRVSQQGNTATFSFTWKPTKGRSFDIVTKLLTVEYTYDAKDICKSQGRQLHSINLAVKKNDGQPTLVIPSMPEVTYGTPISFDIQFVDPSATKDVVPKLKLDFDSGALSGERTVLNGLPAVQCPTAKLEFVDPYWVWHCKFDSMQIKYDDLKDLLGKGLDANALFQMSSKGRSGADSPVAPVSVHITFPLTESKTAPPAQTVQFSAPDTTTKTPVKKASTTATKASN